MFRSLSAAAADVVALMTSAGAEILVGGVVLMMRNRDQMSIIGRFRRLSVLPDARFLMQSILPESHHSIEYPPSSL